MTLATTTNTFTLSDIAMVTVSTCIVVFCINSPNYQYYLVFKMHAPYYYYNKERFVS